MFLGAKIETNYILLNDFPSLFVSSVADSSILQTEKGKLFIFIQLTYSCCLCVKFYELVILIILIFWTLAKKRGAPIVELSLVWTRHAHTGAPSQQQQQQQKQQSMNGCYSLSFYYYDSTSIDSNGYRFMKKSLHFTLLLFIDKP